MKPDRLLFDWPTRHHVHLLLPITIALALVIHAASFFFFRVSYPLEQGRQMRSAEVIFLQPGSPQAKALEPMIAASDPALFSPAGPSELQNRLSSQAVYSAQFDQASPPLAAKPVDSSQGPKFTFFAASPVAVKASEANGKPQAPAIKTFIKVTGALEGREFSPAKEPTYSTASEISLQPAEFSVSVAPDGTIMHVFPVRGSGDETIDQTALRTLLAGKFSSASGGEAPVWGTVVFLWGGDIRREKTP
jgi:hypothetical protein